MKPCIYCGAPTSDYADGRPVCSCCSVPLDAVQTPPKPIEPDQPLEPEEREQIITMFYEDVVQAEAAMRNTRTGTEESHRAALAALEKSVKQYADFALDGKLSGEVQAKLRAGGENA